MVQITELSSEYSYMDSKRIAMLQERFQGSKMKVKRESGESVISVDTLAPGDQITIIGKLPAGMGFESVDGEMIDFLKKQGFMEFLAIPGEPVSPSAEPTPQPAASSSPNSREDAPLQPKAAESAQAGKTRIAPPAFVSSKGMKHLKQVAETRYMMEQVEDADTTRTESTTMLYELFEQGRAGQISTKSATETVERILYKDISGAMAAVTGLRASDQTYAHCVDMAVLFNEAAMGMLKASGKPPNELVSRSTLAAGFLHDIGKSQIPKEILDSTERYDQDSREMELMRSHVTHSAKILSNANMDNAMINVAHYHHVKKNGIQPMSYPDVAYAQVLPLTRLAAIVDVYQALTGKRSYKKNWVPAHAVKYLRDLSGTEYDEAMMAHFLSVIGNYPVGSLVRLSTGDLAFVVKVEGQDLEKPAVVLAENANGEFFTSNPLIDLMEEQDISITEVVDHYEYYNDSTNQAFEVFKSLKIM